MSDFDGSGSTTISFGGDPEVPVNLKMADGALRARAGSNSGVTHDDRLASIVNRITLLSEAISDFKSDVKDIYQEAKSAGYDLKAIRIVVKRRLESDDQRAAREAAEAEAEQMEAALGMLGMLADTPLGIAAREV